MKTLLLLGGSHYIIPVIKTARSLGIKTVTCDYLPQNAAHKFSDEYYNVSIIEKDEVLSLAQKLKIDGIMSFACDPGVTTAAFVAEKMGLPFQGSYKSNCILQDKGLFRAFLKENNFNTPWAKSFCEKSLALKEAKNFPFPVIVKPTDSAGSKGVSKAQCEAELSCAIDAALEKSISKRFIIEEFLTFEGFHSSTDVWTNCGELEFCTFSDQLFDDEAQNPYTPSFIIWPSSMKKNHQIFLEKEIARLMNLLKMKTGIYNVETCVVNNKPYIMEVSARGGGCKIAEIQEMAMGVNLIEREIKKAVGLPVKKIGAWQICGAWCQMVLHNKKGRSGYFCGVEFSSQIKPHLPLVDICAKPGDFVGEFTGADKSLGNIFLHFESRAQLDAALLRTDEWCKIKLSATENAGGGIKPYMHLNPTHKI